MKKLTITLCMVMALTITAIAQPPQAFTYQAVVRDDMGAILQLETVGIRINIHDEVAGGTIIYQENFTEMTNQFGLVNLEIGTGTATIGTFPEIEWGTNSKFIEVEIDQDGGTNYNSMGTSEIVSVPYALFAEGTGKVESPGLVKIAADTDQDGDGQIELTTGDTVRMVITEDGRIGIGTLDPDGLFQVGTGSFKVWRDWPCWPLRKHKVGINEDPWGNSPDAALEVTAGCDIRDPFMISSSSSPIDKAGDLVIVKNDGRVGIGTTQPLTNLHVYGANPSIDIDDAGSSDPVIHFRDEGTVKWSIRDDESNSNAFEIRQGSLSPVMTILTSGNVGIGTTSPERKLVVQGDMRVDDETGRHLLFEKSDIYSMDGTTPATLELQSIYDLTPYASTIINKYGGNVGIGTGSNGPDESAILEVESTEKGVLLPRMTESEIEAIANPANGLTVYNTDNCKYYVYRGCEDDVWQEILFGDHTITPTSGCPTTVSDIEGNIYNTVEIGTQCWMKENLKTTTYNDGIPIPNVTNTNDWAALTSDAYVWYNNLISWKDSYGALYNWYAAANNGLCPTGWHVPTDNEWTILTNFVGDQTSPYGNHLKSCRQVNSPEPGGCNTTTHPRWAEDLYDWGTDVHGFSGLPGGIRNYDGTFLYVGESGRWYSSTEYLGGGWGRGLQHSHGSINVNTSFKQSGSSIGCLK